MSKTIVLKKGLDMQATRNDFPDGVEKHKLSSGKAVSTFPFPEWQRNA